MIHVLFHVDGLLERFGRVVPDAAAMLAAVARIRARLSAGPRGAVLTYHAVRFARVPASRAAGERRALLQQLESWRFAGLAASRVHLEASVADLRNVLPPGSDFDSIILLTASHSRFEEAVAGGVTTFHVGLGTPPEDRGLAAGDVPRMLEEKLRIPTARPMARGVRTGGLLAVASRDHAAGRAVALDAARVDPNADWVTLGATLILYTEEPDLEDRLVERPDVERLSYEVSKPDLVFHPESAAGPSPELYRGSGWVLRASGEGEESGLSGAGPALRWDAVRRSILDEDPVVERRPALGLQPAAYEAALQRFDTRLGVSAGGSDDVVGGGDATRLLTAVRDVVGPAAAADLVLLADAPAALAWTTPFCGGDRDGLVVCIHHPPAPAARAATTAAALALAQTLSMLPNARGGLHCVRLAEGVTVDRMLGALLWDDERHRLSAVVVLDDPRALEQPGNRLRIIADPSLEKALPPEASGVRWSPGRGSGPPRIELSVPGRSSGHPVSIVQAILARLTA